MSPAAALEKGVHLKFAHTEGRTALSYTADGKCALCDMGHWSLVCHLTDPFSIYRSIITCGADTLLKIFDTENFNAEPRTVEYHQTAVTALATHPKVYCMHYPDSLIRTQ